MHLEMAQRASVWTCSCSKRPGRAPGKLGGESAIRCPTAIRSVAVKLDNFYWTKTGTYDVWDSVENKTQTVWVLRVAWWILRGCSGTRDVANEFPLKNRSSWSDRHCFGFFLLTGFKSSRPTSIKHKMLLRLDLHQVRNCQSSRLFHFLVGNGFGSSAVAVFS